MRHHYLQKMRLINDLTGRRERITETGARTALTALRATGFVESTTRGTRRADAAARVADC